jgi:hypothetical protein
VRTSTRGLFLGRPVAFSTRSESCDGGGCRLLVAARLAESRSRPADGLSGPLESRSGSGAGFAPQFLPTSGAQLGAERLFVGLDDFVCVHRSQIDFLGVSRQVELDERCHSVAWVVDSQFDPLADVDRLMVGLAPPELDDDRIAADLGGFRG